jgi:hypothetical protein
MNVNQLFATDQTTEKSGIEIDYGEFWIKIARAGGANKKYNRVLESVSKPYRRAIANGSLPNEKANEILQEVYARSVVLGWGGPGMVDPEGNPLECSVENCIALFKRLPDLFDDIKSQAESFINFKIDQAEQDAKN